MLIALQFVFDVYKRFSGAHFFDRVAQQLCDCRLGEILQIFANKPGRREVEIDSASGFDRQNFTIGIDTEKQIRDRLEDGTQFRLACISSCELKSSDRSSMPRSLSDCI